VAVKLLQKLRKRWHPRNGEWVATALRIVSKPIKESRSMVKTMKIVSQTLMKRKNYMLPRIPLPLNGEWLDLPPTIPLRCKPCSNIQRMMRQRHPQPRHDEADGAGKKHQLECRKSLLSQIVPRCREE
jgi:hypothetical protein